MLSQKDSMDFVKKRASDSTVIATQNVLIVSQKEALESGMAKLSGEIKQLQSRIKIMQEIQANSIQIQYTPQKNNDSLWWYVNSIKGDYRSGAVDSLLSHSILVPQTFSFADPWLKIAGKVNKTGITIDNASFKNQLTASIGWKKKGFLGLGKAKPILEITNSSPYADVSQVSNITIKENKNIFQRKGFWAAVGAAFALFINSKL